MSRGELVVLVNFGDEPATVEVGPCDLVFETESGVDLDGGGLMLPPHAGALLAPA